MTIEQQALDLISENEQLKAQVNLLREALVNLFNGAWDEEHTVLLDKQVRSAIDNTPEQCMNSVKADAIQEMFDKMPLPFNKLRDQGNWMVDYERELRGNNGE